MTEVDFSMLAGIAGVAAVYAGGLFAVRYTAGRSRRKDQGSERSSVGRGTAVRPPDRRIAAPDGTVLRWSSAGASTELVPTLEKILENRFSLYIVGYGGQYLAKRTEYRQALQLWLDQFDCKIHYIVISPDENYLKIYRELESRGSKGRFFSYPINADDISNEQLRKQVRALETFHPILLAQLKADAHTGAPSSEEEPRAMWLEGHHPRDSLTAYDIDFIDFKKIRSEPRTKQFQDLLHVLKLVMAESSAR